MKHYWLEINGSSSILWEINSVGRASALHAEGRGFESLIFHHISFVLWNIKGLEVVTYKTVHVYFVEQTNSVKRHCEIHGLVASFTLSNSCT